MALELQERDPNLRVERGTLVTLALADGLFEVRIVDLRGQAGHDPLPVTTRNDRAPAVIRRSVLERNERGQKVRKASRSSRARARTSRLLASSRCATTL